MFGDIVGVIVKLYEDAQRKQLENSDMIYYTEENEDEVAVFLKSAISEENKENYE